jgi:hypothetical protein
VCACVSTGGMALCVWWGTEGAASERIERRIRASAHGERHLDHMRCTDKDAEPMVWGWR